MSAFGHPLRKLNLNQLYSLDAILSERSLTEAGRRVRLSQPAMSVALRKLREQFADELIVYAGGRPVLTALAEALQPRVRQILRDIDDAFRLKLEFDPMQVVRSFTIAASESLEIMLLSRVIPVLLREAPGIDIRVVPFNPGAASRASSDGIDIIVVPERFADPTLHGRVLMRETASCMVWEGHPGIGNDLTAEQYLAFRHVAVEDPQWTAASHDPSGQTLLRQRDIAVSTRRHAALPGLILGTSLIATASGWLLQHFASMMPLKVLSFPIAEAPEAILAQWPAHRANDPALRWLRERIVDATAPFDINQAS